jgi:anti-sigma regulatory factor (Ser/Thr protein kinase)
MTIARTTVLMTGASRVIGQAQAAEAPATDASPVTRTAQIQTAANQVGSLGILSNNAHTRNYAGMGSLDSRSNEPHRSSGGSRSHRCRPLNHLPRATVPVPLVPAGREQVQQHAAAEPRGDPAARHNHHRRPSSYRRWLGLLSACPYSCGTLTAGQELSTSAGHDYDDIAGDRSAGAPLAARLSESPSARGADRSGPRSRMAPDLHERDLPRPRADRAALSHAFMTRTARRMFPGRHRQVACARAFIRSVVTNHPMLEDAVLLTSELCTNALQHTASGNGGSFEVAVYRSQEFLRVEVHDGGSLTTPAVQTFRDLPDDGRGLELVALIADRWGQSGDKNGRFVFFELDGTVPEP